MAHQTDIPYLNSSNILQYMNMLAVVLMQQHNYNLNSFDILIVGGSAIALKHGFRGSVDIDADARFGGAISRSVKIVSDTCKIPSDWFNQDFTKSSSYSKRIWDDAIYMTTLQGYMNIYLVSDLSQLCMKLVSGRPKDMNDILFLTDMCFRLGVSFEGVLLRFQYLYGDTCKPKSKALSLMKKRFKFLAKSIQ